MTTIENGTVTVRVRSYLKQNISNYLPFKMGNIVALRTWNIHYFRRWMVNNLKLELKLSNCVHHEAEDTLRP